MATNSTLGTLKRLIESTHPILFNPIVPNFIFSLEPIILDDLPNVMVEGANRLTPDKTVAFL